MIFALTDVLDTGDRAYLNTSGDGKNISRSSILAVRPTDNAFRSWYLIEFGNVRQINSGYWLSRFVVRYNKQDVVKIFIA
jgi:hypothetical protein